MDAQKYQDIMEKGKPVLHHRAMSVSHRAKQFAPFAALKGFEEAVEETAYLSAIQTEITMEEIEII